MLIGYSTFLINIYLGILVFQLGIFCNVKTLLTNWYILCLFVALNITCCSQLTLFSQIILNKCWKPVSWLCTFSQSQLKLNCGWGSDKIRYPWLFDCIGYTVILLLFVTLPDNFNCFLGKFNWVNTQIRSLIKVLQGSWIYWHSTVGSQ